jgi:hypothetical protein
MVIGNENWNFFSKLNLMEVMKMALQKNYIKNIYGKNINFENSYSQITHVEGDKNFISFQVFSYDDINKLNIINQKNYAFTPNTTDGSENFIKQGYEYLKTLDEFKDAVDC